MPTTTNTTRTHNYETDHIDRVVAAEHAELDKHGPASDAPKYDEDDAPLYRLHLSAFHANAETHYLSVTDEQVQAIRAILAESRG